MKPTLAVLALLTITLPLAVMSINEGKASTALPLPMSFSGFDVETSGQHVQRVRQQPQSAKKIPATSI